MAPAPDSRVSNRASEKNRWFFQSVSMGPAPGEPEPWVALFPTSGRIMQSRRKKSPKSTDRTFPVRGEANGPGDAAGEETEGWPVGFMQKALVPQIRSGFKKKRGEKRGKRRACKPVRKESRLLPVSKTAENGPEEKTQGDAINGTRGRCMV